jgi:zinc transporter ZupT
MARATCLLVEPWTSSGSLRPIVQSHATCFEVLEAHSLGEVTRSLSHLGELNSAVIDDRVQRADEIASVLRHSFPHTMIIIVSDRVTRGFDEATAVVPHNFPHALAVALRREAAKRRQPI